VCLDDLQTSEDAGEEVAAAAQWANWTRLWFVLNSVDKDKFVHYRTEKRAKKLEGKADEARGTGGDGGGGGLDAGATEGIMVLDGDVVVTVDEGVPLEEPTEGASGREREAGAHQNVFSVKHAAGGEGGGEQLWVLQADNKAAIR
jgi:hypothetical protein